jgi:MFS family permease
VFTPLARLFLAAVLIHGAYDAARVAISYRVLALGGDAVAVGVVAATFAVLPMLLALHFGRRVDRRGAWGTLTAGTALSAGALLAAATSTSIMALAVANTVMGLGQIMTLIACQGFVMELTERSRHVNGFAMFTLAVSLGQSVGTPVMGVLLQANRDGDTVETGVPLLVMALTILVALPLALTLPRARVTKAWGAGDVPSVARGRRHESMATLLHRPGMKASIYAALVVVTGVDLVTAYLPVVGETAGLSPMVVTLLVATRSVFSMVARGTMPWILRRWRQTTVLVATPIITTPALVVLGLSGHALVLGAALAVIGFFWGLNQPVTMNWVTTVAPARERGAALSLRLTGNRLAQVIVPLGAGALTGPLGPGAVFLVSGVMSAVSVVTTTSSLKNTPMAELGTVPARQATSSSPPAPPARLEEKELP